MGRSVKSRRARASPRDWRRGSPSPPGSPCRRTSTIQDRSPGPNATCCWARSRSSRLRSFGRPLRRVDRRRPVLREWAFAGAAEIDLFLDLLLDREAGGAEHRFGACLVRNPPVGPVVRILVFDEVQLGKPGLEEDVGLLELI